MEDGHAEREAAVEREITLKTRGRCLIESVKNENENYFWIFEVRILGGCSRSGRGDHRVAIIYRYIPCIDSSIAFAF